MKLDFYTHRALRDIEYHNDYHGSWRRKWCAKSVEKLLSAGYVRPLDLGGIWITDAGRAALREHQEERG